MPDQKRGKFSADTRPDVLLAFDLVSLCREWTVKAADEEMGAPPFRVEREICDEPLARDRVYRTQVLAEGIADYRIAQGMVQALRAAGTAVALGTGQVGVE